MGRAVYTALFKPNKVDVRSFFRQGQTALLYNMEDNSAIDFRPTVLKRPKAECEEAASMVMPNTDATVITTLARILSYIQPTHKHPHSVDKWKKEVTGKEALLESMLGPKGVMKDAHSKKEMKNWKTSEVVVPSDDDIFTDAGRDYVVDLKRKKKKSSIKASVDTPSEPILITQPMNVDQEEGEIPDRDDDQVMLKMDRKTGAQIDPTSLPDHYAECYPGFHQGYDAAVVDSDDEDYSHMEVKGKSVSRFNFGTDEEWSKYKQNMEQLPKAAFQFGVKMTDGRKTHSKLVEKHRSKQKLDTQLTKIEKLFKEQGHSHEVAFRSDKPTTKTDTSMTSLPTPKTRKRINIG